jgi:hypothetical protein
VGDPRQRFAVLPPGVRRALLSCAGCLLAGYVGAALLVAGVTRLFAREDEWPFSVTLALCGLALAIAGLVRARTIGDRAAPAAEGRIAPVRRRGGAVRLVALPTRTRK